MKEKRNLLTGTGLIGAFALWTVLIQCVDVQTVGQNGTKIGFADFNRDRQEFPHLCELLPVKRTVKNHKIFATSNTIVTGCFYGYGLP